MSPQRKNTKDIEDAKLSEPKNALKPEENQGFFKNYLEEIYDTSNPIFASAKFSEFFDKSTKLLSKVSAQTLSMNRF